MLPNFTKNLPNFTPPDFAKLAPPEWLIAETHNRIVLLLNHVLQQNPAAMQQIAHQSGKVVAFEWHVDLGFFGKHATALQLSASKIGLLEVKADAKPDLTLAISDESPLAVAQKFMSGDKPNVRIEGDIHLASVVQWLSQNVKWDIEADLAKIFGDVGAHRMHAFGKAISQQLKTWIAKK